MATIKVIGKNGKTGFKLYLRITIDRKTIDYAFKLKQPIEKKHWAEEQQIIKSGNLNHHYINSIIQSKKNEASKIISRIESEKGVVRYAEFHKLYRISKGTTGNPKDFFSFFESVMKAKSGNNKIVWGTEKIYKVTLAKLKRYRNTLLISDIDYNFIEGFEIWLRQEYKVGDGTIYNYLSKLKGVLSTAVKKGEISRNPFENYKLTTSEGMREYLPESDLHKLFSLVTDNERLLRTMIMGKVQCYTGLDYANLTKISSTNIVDGLIIFRRDKTQKPTTIPIIDDIKELFDNLINTTPAGEPFFKIANKNYNTNLRLLAKATKMDKPISSHILRHTFATLALTKGISIETISSVLGHKNIRTTQIYAKIIDTKKIEEMKKLNS